MVAPAFVKPENHWFIQPHILPCHYSEEALWSSIMRLVSTIIAPFPPSDDSEQQLRHSAYNWYDLCQISGSDCVSSLGRVFGLYDGHIDTYTRSTFLSKRAAAVLGMEDSNATFWPHRGTAESVGSCIGGIASFLMRFYTKNISIYDFCDNDKCLPE